MSSEVGSGHVSIFPVMTGFKGKVARETRDAGTTGGKSFAGSFAGAGATAGRMLGTGLKSSLTVTAGNLGADQLKTLTSGVASAAAALSKARLKQQDDAGKVRVAETRLAEAIARSGEGSSQAVAAAERLASARRRAGAATDVVTAASGRLKAAQDALAGAQARTTQASTASASGFAKIASSVRAAAGPIASAASSAFQGVVGAASRAASAAGQALGQGLQTPATGAVTVAAAGIAVAFSKGFARLTAIDTAQAKLRGLGNDAGTVTAIMGDALASVKGTSFGLGEAATVAASAVAAGIKPGEALQGHLKRIANNASAAGMSMQDMGSIFNKAATQANGVQNDVISQLADRGIPIYQALATQLGVTAGEVFKMASEGKIDFETFSKAAEAAAGTVADEMGKTVPGAAKNFVASLGRIGANALGGLYTKIGPLIAAATSALGPIEAKAKAFGDVLLRAVGPALDFVTNLLNKIGDGSLAASGGFDKILAVLGPVGGAFAALGAGGLAGLLTKIPLLGGMLGGLTGPLALLGGPLGIAAAAFAGFLASGSDASGLVDAVTGIVSGITSALPGIVQTVATVVPQIVSSIVSQIPLLLGAATGIVIALVQGLVVALPAIATGALQLLQGLITAIVANLPLIIQAAISLVMALIQGIVTALPLLIEGALQLVTGLLTAIVAALPMIIQGGVQLLMALVMGLVQALPMLLEAALQLILGLLQAIIDNLPMIIDAGIQLLLALITGLVNMLPTLIETAITLVVELIAGLVQMFPQIIAAGVSLIISLVEGLVKAIPKIVAMIPQIISAIWDTLANVDWGGLGAQIIQGLINGLKSMMGAVGDTVGGIIDFIGGFFPHSPAKRGPFSGSGWTRLRQSGAAMFEQFNAGALDEAPRFAESVEAMAAAASQRAQLTIGSVAGTVATARGTGPGTTDGATAPGQVNNIEVTALPGMSPQEQAELIAKELRWA